LTPATSGPDAGDDLFFFNSTVTTPVEVRLFTGTKTLMFNSLNFRSNTGKLQLNRAPNRNASNTNIHIGEGGITMDAGAGPVTFGASGQNVHVGVKSDTKITNNSDSDLTFQKDFFNIQSSSGSINTVTVAGSGAGNIIFSNLVVKYAKRDLAMTINTNGSGVVRFHGNCDYTGATSVMSGKLFINGDSSKAAGPVSVSAGATLGGTGTLGGDVTIAENGCLEVELGAEPEKHTALSVAAPRKLAFSGASQLTITSSGGAQAGKYKLISAPGGITGSAPATLHLPDGWKANVSIAGSDLLLDLTSTGAR
jgi:hypothetical protein